MSYLQNKPQARIFVVVSGGGGGGEKEVWLRRRNIETLA